MALYLVYQSQTSFQRIYLGYSGNGGNSGRGHGLFESSRHILVTVVTGGSMSFQDISWLKWLQWFPRSYLGYTGYSGNGCNSGYRGKGDI